MSGEGSLLRSLGSSAGRTARRTAKRKQRGLTCSSCRARKIRCEGTQPRCQSCEAFGDECCYEKAPPMSRILEMAQRLQEAEQLIAAIDSESAARSQSALSPLPSTPGQSGVLSTEIRTSLPACSSVVPVDLDVPNASYVDLPESQGRSIKQITPTATVNVPSSRLDSPEISAKDLPMDLSVDQDGKICYYGPTSAVHEAPGLESSQRIAPLFAEVTTKLQAQSLLVAKATESRIWENFGIGSVTGQTHIPHQIISKLLQLHWTWIGPMFMWVYRPAFMDDMSTGGQYYSEFLLVVICAHAAGYYDKDVSSRLMAKARALLGPAIYETGAVPTVQALLQLSGRDLAHGSLSHAWLYSGMAFRMARDLGLHHSGPAIPHLDPVDMEVRRRLFWSCYLWDKVMSLYTGRTPALIELPDDANFEFLDDSAENELWSPFYFDSPKLARMTPGEYPQTKAHLVSCFANSCRIAIIINDVIFQLYSRRGGMNTNTALQNIMARLDTWRAESAPHLRYDADSLPDTCPPPHILSQNLLYYTTVILARRPFWSIDTHHQACIGAAWSIEKLLLLMERSFGLENITYIIGYCTYTGASAILQDAKRGNLDANAMIQTFIRVLQGGLKRLPVLERSLDIIYKGLKPLLNHCPSRNEAPLVGELTPSYIPAFPHWDGSDFRLSAGFGTLDVDPLALDCFPEAQMHMSEFTLP